MAKQITTTELEQIKTDTNDKLAATLSFEVTGLRNVPNLQNLGRAADAAAWLFRKMLEASYIKAPEAYEAQLNSIREQTRSRFTKPVSQPPQPQPQFNTSALS